MQESEDRDDRAAERFTVSDGSIRLRAAPGEFYDAVVTDDSYGGVGVVVELRQPRVAKGDRVKLIAADGEMFAYVRYIVAHDDVWRVGLEWEQPGAFRAGDSWVGDLK